MKDTITISGQVFKRSAGGTWVEEETNIPANKGLQTLLELAANGQLSADDVPVDPHIAERRSISVETDEDVEQKLREQEAQQEALTDDINVVTIAGSKYVYDETRGWIDAKSKRQVPKEVLNLIIRVTGKANPSSIKVEPNYDIEPITIADTKYIFDTKKRHWILEKGKKKAPEDVQRLLSRFVSSAALDKLDQKETLPTKIIDKPEKRVNEHVESSDNVAVPAQQAPAERIKSSDKMVQMVNILASIADSLAADALNSYNRDRDREAWLREESIEKKKKGDAKREKKKKKKKKKKGSKVPWTLIAAGLIAARMDSIVGIADDVVEVVSQLDSFFTGMSKAIAAVSDAIDKGEFWKKITTTEEEGGWGVNVVRDKTVDDHTEDAKRLEDDGGVMGRLKEMTDPSEWFSLKENDDEPTADTKAGTKGSQTKIRDADRASENETLLDKAGVTTAPPRGDIAALNRWLQSNGLRTDMDKDRPDPRSSHGHGRAIDVNVGSGNVEANDPVMGARFDALADLMTNAGYNVLWRKKGHYNHIHVQTGLKGVNSRSLWKSKSTKGDPAAGPTPQTHADKNTTTDEDKEVEPNSTMDAWMDSDLRESLLNFKRDDGGTYISFKKSPESTEDVSRINELSIKKYADKVDQTEEEDASNPLNIPQPPNLNQKSGGTVQTPPAASEKDVVNDYLRYFGLEPINHPLRSS